MWVKTIKSSTGLRVVAPMIGDITNDTVRVLDGGREATVNLNLTVTDQGEFGKHGFIGDFEVSYDMAEDEKVVDLIVQDDFFVHYFTLPRSGHLLNFFSVNFL